MSACWDSDRLALHGARARHLVMRPRRPLAAIQVSLVLLVACLLGAPGDAVASWFCNSAHAATSRHDRDRDSLRVTKKIVVSDDGIEIVGSGVQEQVVRNVVRNVKRNVDRGRVRVSVDPSDDEVDVDGGDGDTNADAGDTLEFKDGDVQIGPHGITVDADEDAGMVRMFSDAEVPPGERIEGDVVAVFGDVLVEGQVSGNVVAVFGSVRMEPGARIDGDAVAVGGALDQPPGAAVGGESVSLGFLPIHWGAPTVGMMIGVVFVGWIASLFSGWILMLLFPSRMVRTAMTASSRTGGSLVLGLVSGPLLIIAIVLLLVTVIGIPIAFLLPLVYLISLWAGQLALSYALGCRLMRRRLGEGATLPPLAAGTLFVAGFFVMGALLGTGEGFVRTIALFFHLLGFLLVMGLSVIGIGAFLLSRMGTRPREFDYAPLVGAAPAAGMGPSLAAPGAEPPTAPLAPPAT
jgi:hypothetical protein